MMNKHKIPLGPTFKGYISSIGFLVFAFGIVMLISQFTHSFSFLFSSIGVILTIVGFIMFLNIKGVIIDKERNLIKPYFNLIFTKIGAWESLNNYDKLVLTYKNESNTMNSRFNSTKYSTKTFEITLASKNNIDIKFKEFEDYNEAKSFLIDYNQILSFDYLDTYEIIKEKIVERKQYTRR
jgi:hypothetical protein